MNKKIGVIIAAILLVFAVISGCVGIFQQEASQDNSTQSVESDQRIMATHDVVTVWIVYVTSMSQSQVAYIVSYFENNEYKVDRILSDHVKVYNSELKRVVYLEPIGLGDNQYLLYYPVDEILPLGLSELKSGAEDRVDIAKIEGNILTINYSGNPDKVKITVFSKENSGKDIFDETHFLSEAFIANEHEWKFMFAAGEPLPNVVMALVVYKDPHEMEQYERVYERKYIALDIKPTKELQGGD